MNEELIEVQEEPRESGIEVVRELIGSNIQIDPTLTIEGAAADAKATGDRIRAVESDVDDLTRQLSDLGNVTAFKAAILQLAQKVAYIDEHGQDYYDDLYDAFYPPVQLASISAVFTQGQAVVYDTDSLDVLKPMLVVTAVYSDGTSGTVSTSDYTLSGTLSAGTSTITVSYGGKTDTFSVSVTHRAGTYSVTNNLTNCTNSNGASTVIEGENYSGTISSNSGYTMTGATVRVTMGGTDITSTAYRNGTVSIASVSGNIVINASSVAVTLSSISAVLDPNAVVTTNDTLQDLRQYLTVTALYSDSSTSEVSEYTLSGSLSVGVNSITVAYSGVSTTVSVTVVDYVSSISAVFSPGANVIYTYFSLDDLKQYLTVTANYYDGTSQTINDYTLSGSLVVGTNAITVSSNGKTTTFNVTAVAYEIQLVFALGSPYATTSVVKYTPNFTHMTNNPMGEIIQPGTYEVDNTGVGSEYQFAVNSYNYDDSQHNIDWSFVQGTEKTFLSSSSVSYTITWSLYTDGSSGYQNTKKNIRVQSTNTRVVFNIRKGSGTDTLTDTDLALFNNGGFVLRRVA